MIWKPSVTVAAIVERDGRFLLVEEHTDRGQLFNQPAGHRSPLVMRCVDDYLSGHGFPLDLLRHEPH